LDEEFKKENFGYDDDDNTDDEGISLFVFVVAVCCDNLFC
jgi:hypothetical protein